MRQTLRLTLVACGALAVASCSVFRPLDTPSPPRMAVDWAVPLYPLESFAYKPLETGSPLHIGSGPGPGGLVVVGSDDRNVRAFDAVTGRHRWTTPTRGPVVARPVPVADDVIVASMDGRVYRLRQRNGRAVWKSDPVGRGALVTTPVVHGDRVFVTGDDNRLSALKLADGAPLWDRHRPHRGEFTVTGQAGALVAGDAVITGFSDGQLVAFSAEDGATLWSADLAMGERRFVDSDATPRAVGDVIVGTSYQSGLHGLEAATGQPRWRVYGEGYGTPAVDDTMLYVPQAGGRVVAVDGLTGAVAWVARFRDGVPRTPAVSERYVLVPIETSLVVLDRGTGRALFRYDDMHGFTATPDVAWGTVYAQSNSGHLYALGLW